MSADDPTLIQVDRGAVFKLRDGLTYEQLMAVPKIEPQPWLCRTGWHRRRVVADAYIGSDDADLHANMLTMISRQRAITVCKRCGQLETKMASY